MEEGAYLETFSCCLFVIRKVSCISAKKKSRKVSYIIWIDRQHEWIVLQHFNKI